jgi:hypothetical protein
MLAVMGLILCIAKMSDSSTGALEGTGYDQMYDSNKTIKKAASSTLLENEASPEKISGSGSITRDYYVSNKANEHAKVSIDIKNASHYEYTYQIRSDKVHCLAGLTLVVEHAESITCSGDALNRDRIPANVGASIKNGNLSYSSLLIASGEGVESFQEIINGSADQIDAIDLARRDSSIIMGNIIAANRSEIFNSTQYVSAGIKNFVNGSIRATAGPLRATSYFWQDDHELNATADVTAGAVSIDQAASSTVVRQDSRGVIGGARFDTAVKNASKYVEHVYSSAGSGNLINLSQEASKQDAKYELEYEYLPVYYQTGIFDMEYAEAGSDTFSDKNQSSRAVTDNCEHIQIRHKADLNEDPMINTSASAIAGPVNITSFVETGNQKLDTKANVAAGVVSIDQLINLTKASQKAIGVAGGASFRTSIANGSGYEEHIFSSIGSGNLISLLQNASAKSADYALEYEYMPVSYNNLTYDAGYADGGSDIFSNESLVSRAEADNCEHLQITHRASLNEDPMINTSARAIAGPLEIASYAEATDRRLNATANVTAGIIAVDQLINLTHALQKSKGVTGGATLDALISNGNGKKIRAYSLVGSGNLIDSMQYASWANAHSSAEYEYMPASYQTGVYDANINSSKVERT